ncbi:MAG: sulfatase-like hydrolase/transferase, partial [Alphaproteobacteria bacterium]
MRFLLRAFGGFLFICLVLVAVGGGWAAWRWSQSEANDKAADDPAHLAAKHRYLTEIARDFGPGGSQHIAENARPNLVVILFDDLGWGDIGAYGNKAIATPAMDGLAENGARFTHYFSPAPYCTPSRAGLLTGRLPVRTNLTQVTFPDGSLLNGVMRIAGAGLRLPRHEITLPEILGAAGYRTAMIGKWHLGAGKGAEPMDFGFERYFGVLHSNDMEPLPLYRDRRVVEEHPIDQTTLTARYTNEAGRAIKDFSASGKPFFLYFAHTFPHIPLYAPAEKRGQSKAGLYGDVVEELDRSVAGVMAALTQAGVADNTIVIITSDNGPWYEGAAGPVRGRKN